MLKMIQQLLQKMNLKCHISYLEPLLKERLYRLILISLYSSADESAHSASDAGCGRTSSGTAHPPSSGRLRQEARSHPRRVSAPFL